MKPSASLLLSGCLAIVPGGPAMAEGDVPSVGIQSEKLCTERPPSLFNLRAEAAGLTPPLHFLWDLGNGMQRSGPEVLEQAYEFGRYDVVLAVRDAAGRVKKASMALDVEAQGCGGI
ncbi:MAG: hypothetical protein HY778_00605 [Betaproteobacteria bacterium]|nr:hypothetical protein [Betaproteobacteria bacterium]